MDAREKVRSSQSKLCKEQGGSVLDGREGDPHSGHEAPKKEVGHGSASSPGVSGTNNPGK